MICLAKREDAFAIASLEAILFSMPWTKEGFLEAIDGDNASVWVAKEEEEILGYLVMYTYIDEGEITNVAVSPDARRRGLGGQLLDAAIAYAKDHSFTQIVLEVRASNKDAISLYRAHEFADLGIRKNFYERPKEDALIMAWQEK